MARSVPLEDQLDTLVSLLASGVGAASVEVRSQTSAGERVIASWPEGATAGSGGSVTTVPVRQGDELLGSVQVTKPVTEPLTPPEGALVAHVASQAGMLLRNLRLTSCVHRVGAWSKRRTSSAAGSSATSTTARSSSWSRSA
jgi:hypothetical protein